MSEGGRFRADDDRAPEEGPALAGRPTAARPVAPPGEADEIAAQALRLARELQYLTWPDRARALDGLLWASARAMLTSEEITAVINRQPLHAARGGRIAAYAARCSTFAATLLAALGERGAVGEELQALTMLLSEAEADREAAVAWIERHGCGAIEAQLAGLPGYAFFFLTVHPNDSAESFMARDAFRAAMLGRG